MGTIHQSTAMADRVLRTAAEVAKAGVASLAVLDDVPAPIYVTDAEGTITYFNPACIGFSGRTPVLGEDRWCVAWKLYTEDGTRLPHDQYPLAVTARARRPVRSATAVAERPDGTRVDFMPYATPLLGEGGELLGAVNVLIDVTDIKTIERLRMKARKCLRLAVSIGDPRSAAALTLMAAKFQEQALTLSRSVEAPPRLGDS